MIESRLGEKRICVHESSAWVCRYGEVPSIGWREI